MKQKDLERWEKFRKPGKKNYVIKIGVLYQGVLTAVLWSAVMHFMVPQAPWYIRPIIALILFPAGGVFFGLWTWKINEKKYQKIMQDKDSFISK